MKKCPKCGGKHLAPILYGYPVFDGKMERKIANNELVLGGCCITGCDPQYHCFDCGKNVCKPPIVMSSKNGEEDYRDIVTSVIFSDGGFIQGFKKVEIRKLQGRIVAKVTSTREPIGSTIELTEKEWKKLMDRLFCKLYVHEWKKTYDDPDVLDGEQWELKFRLTNKRVREYSGSNDFPAYWNELKRTFQPFFKKV